MVQSKGAPKNSWCRIWFEPAQIGTAISLRRACGYSEGHALVMPSGKVDTSRAIHIFFCLRVPDSTQERKPFVRSSSSIWGIDRGLLALRVIAAVLVAVLKLMGWRFQHVLFPPTICLCTYVSLSATVSWNPFREAHSLIINGVMHPHATCFLCHFSLLAIHTPTHSRYGGQVHWYVWSVLK